MIAIELPKVNARFTLGFILWLTMFVVVFGGALASAVDVWSASKTYNHCFFVLPLSAYFLWDARGRVAPLPPAPVPWVLLLTVPLIFLWGLGVAADINFFQHVAIFTMLPIIVVSVVGFAVARQIWFPLVFMLFAIPVGEEAVPWLQQVTADISVPLLELSGVSVYRQGLYISVPEGDFHVAEACSGIRFFIASIMLGAVFAYLNYRTAWRAIVFMVIAVVLPVLANGVRAYGIMMVGHLTDMEHATGADHLVYGWVFFAIVIVLLFFVGSLWREEVDPEPTDFAVNPQWQAWQSKPLLLWAFAPSLLALLLQATVLKPGHQGRTIEAESLPGNAVEQLRGWQPHYNGAQEYIGGLGDGVYYYVGWYSRGKGGAELISSANTLYRKESWSIRSQKRTDVDGTSAAVLSLVTAKGAEQLIVYWYQTALYRGPSGSIAKISQAVDILTGGTGAGAVVALSTFVAGYEVDSAYEMLLHKVARYESKFSSSLLSTSKVEP